MTPRTLREFINELPESLLDIDIEFAVDFQELSVTDQDVEKENGLYGARQDCYIGGMIHSEADKSVVLMTAETLDKIIAYQDKTGGTENGVRMIRASELTEHEIIACARNLAHRIELFHSWERYFDDESNVIAWLTEEIGELLVAMTHYYRRKVDMNSVIEEVVDVLICIVQLALSLNAPPGEFANMVHTKLDKATARMEKLGYGNHDQKESKQKTNRPS